MSFDNNNEGVKEAATAATRKRSFKIELCGRLSVFQLFHVGHVVRNRLLVLSPD